MERSLLSRAAEFINQQRKKKRWQKAVTAMAAVVVFCTTYALILPAITMEAPVFCGQEAHTHEAACYETVLSCEQSEGAGHTHGDDCYQSQRTLVCGLEESPGHTHTAGCQLSEPRLVCEEDHLHGEECYTTATTYTCGLEETAGHAHGDSCWKETLSLVCGQSEAGHVHSEDCDTQERLICELEEHHHTDACYADPDADLESAAQWERTFADVILTENYPADVLAIAETQLGYTESAKNYIVNDEGRKLGYSRYGAWYGDPYGDWCAMFVSFCLHYADIPAKEFPREANCQRWIQELTQRELYQAAENYTPKPGDLIFFNWDEEPDSDHVGIVKEIIPGGPDEPDEIKTIEGNASNRVKEVTYTMDDASILGYGLLPEGPPEEPEESAPETETGDGDLSDLSDFDRSDVEAVIQAIDGIPSADEIDEKILAFEEIEDYEGEEIWLMEVYQRVQETYAMYAALSEDLQAYVSNRDKILELEYIWSRGTLEEPVVMADAAKIAQTIAYDPNIFDDTTASFVVYTQSGSNYYAFDGNGNAVQIYIDSSGNITSNAGNKDLLLWTFTKQGGSNEYLIRNLSTSRYMHAYPNDGSGVTTTGAYSSVLESGSGGVRIRSNSEYARLNTSSMKFVVTQTQGSGARFRFGIVREAAVWLDGTNGGLMSLTGSPDQKVTVQVGDTYTLPTTWPSPNKYSYTLRGWYDVVNSQYYAPGAEITVEKNLVFYADWVAASYNVGQNGNRVANTVSTNDFITTRMFDYSSMINMHSTQADVTVNASEHSEIWSVVTSGTVPYNNENTWNYVFIDYDPDGDLSYAYNRGGHNASQGDVTAGLYSSSLADMLFDPGTEVLGKQYLGTADHLFQYGADKSDTEHYGYYYYDSRLNAASYNRDAGRFYVYDYLERTSDSAKDGGLGAYSDFLPFNSPHVNTNGKNVGTYSYSGEHGEYPGTTHYQYDAKDNGQGSAIGNVGTNYWYGMRTDIRFYLPNRPGTTDSEGHLANQSITGDNLVFEFSGDDDVWVLVDGNLVLDIGGMHGIQSGSINFSTGEVSGVQAGSVTDLDPGEHTLTLLYLERGSSQSNCKIRFNITPRYTFTIQKEDVLTRALLNGAEFSVYMDQDCEVPAQLWTSRAAYNSDAASSNVFEVVDGKATMWGFSPGQTYYIKETKQPDGGYGVASGIIKLTLNNKGTASYDVIQDQSKISTGFNVHGFKVDYETQEAFLVATNSQYQGESTEVSVEKVWSDGGNHAGTPVTVYLLADGERIREVTLSEDNNWQYVWKNLPKYRDEEEPPIQYTVQEGLVADYVGFVTDISTEDGNFAYQITNRPASELGSLKVTKQWNTKNMGGSELYENLEVQVDLLMNGQETGVSGTLSLRNNWTYTFTNLPMDDQVVYTVAEHTVPAGWTAQVGEVTKIHQRDYAVTLTNTYNATYMLPETGGMGNQWYLLGGILLIAGGTLWYKKQNNGKGGTKPS